MENGGGKADPLALAKSIAQARRKAGLTQQDLCMKANLSYSTLAKIERGAIKTPSVFTVAVIAAATNTTVEELTGISPKSVQQKNYKTAKNGLKFVYFDVNGVLVRFFQRAFTDIAAKYGVSAHNIESTYWHYNDAICRGDMPLSEFNQILATKLGVEQIAWEDYYISNVEPIKETKEILTWVSQYYPVGLLTNVMPGTLDQMIAADIVPNIDYTSIIDSSIVGNIKPEVEIYQKAEELAGFKGQEILFIDDTSVNLMAAEKLNWHVIWFDYYRPEESTQRIKEVLEF